MKIQCLNQNLKSIIQIAERNTSKSQVLPVLNSVFIEAGDGKIKIRATNLETAIEISLSGKILEPGSIVIPSKPLGAFISNISEDQIILQSHKNNLFIKTTKTKTTIQGYPPEDFPIFPKIETIHSFNLPAPELKQSISSVIVAASLSDIKPELSSLFFNVFKNNVKIAATDSFRLAEKTITSKNIYSTEQISFLVPQKSAQEAIKLLEKDEDVEVGVGKNQFFLKTPSIKFLSRLTEGKFPEYDQIIPKNFKTTSLAKKTDIVSHIKISSVFVGKLNDIGLVFDPVKKNILLSTTQQDIGEHSSEVESDIQGEEVSAKFNWRYLLDGVSQINQEYILFHLNNNQTPLLIKGKGDSGYVYIVMPMRGI